MSAVPSIKGSVFARYAEEVSKLVASGTISRSELARRLRPEDLALLEQPVMASAWYDIQIYGRILELLRDTVGEGRNEYWVQQGAQSAERLLKQGLYQQLDYLKRTQLTGASDPHERFLAFGRDLKLLSTIRGSIFNFSRQVVKVDPDYADRYILEVTEAEAFPDALCWTNLGFINRMAAEHGTPNLWRWERPRRDLILYRMTRPV